MAKLAELGRQFPCTTQGVQIPIDDAEYPICAGQVLEAWFEADRDINIDQAFDTIVEVLRMKEEYPHFVLHYVKVETRKVTVQYSLAPAGTTASPALIAIAIFFTIIAIVSLVTIGSIIRWTRGYLWSPIGTAIVNAKHTETKKGISGVKIYVGGKYAGTTDGGSISVPGLLVGPWEFSGEPKEGFHDPMAVTKEILLNEVTNIDIWYRPSDIPEPKTGYLYVYTHPVPGVIYIDGEEIGPAPISLDDITVGDHIVAFGGVDGYITPKPQTATIVGGLPTTITGYYKEPEEEEEWWNKILKYGLIGGGIIFGSVLLIPELIRLARTRGEKK